MDENTSNEKKIIEIPANQAPYQEQIKNRRLRTCAYCRVSSSTDEQLHSFDAQYGYYSNYIQKNENWVFAGIYADEGITGTSRQRRQRFNDMIEDCEEGKIDLIITKSITRFARNVVDCISTVRKLRAMGIAVYFEKERLNTLLMENERILTIWGTVAQEESMSTSKNAHWACVRRFENGTFVLSKAPYGYRKDEEKELIIYEPEAEIVRKIAGDYLDGIGCGTIAGKLNSSGIPGPTGKKWYQSTVLRILKNEKMVGDYLMQKRITNGIVPFRQLTNKGQARQYLISDDHEGILSREDKEKIDFILSVRQSEAGRDLTASSIGCEYIVCGRCGGKLSREYAGTVRGDNKIIWRCKNRHSNNRTCTLKLVRDEDLGSAMQRLPRKMQRGKALVFQPLLKQLEAMERRLRLDGRIREIEKELAEVKMQRHVLLRMRAEGYMEPSLFLARNQTLDQEQRKLMDEKNLLQGRGSCMKQIEGLKNLITFLDLEAGLDPIVKKKVLYELIKKIEVLDQRIFQFDMTCGLELIVDLDEGIYGTNQTDTLGVQTM